MKIAIAGMPCQTANYENAIKACGAIPYVTLQPESAFTCDALLLPGGYDIDPSYFNEINKDSRNIDYDLDFKQLEMLDYFVKIRKPVLGICKGMQVINVYFGGNISQDISRFKKSRELSICHTYQNGDQIHSTTACTDSFLYELYGKTFITNSAHHQALSCLGANLEVIQTAADGIIEGIVHTCLPIIGVQWHPERMCCGLAPANTVDGSKVFQFFLHLCGSSSI